jgi:hypothetical protein
MSDVDGCRLPWSSLLNMYEAKFESSEEFDSLAKDGLPALVGWDFRVTVLRKFEFLLLPCG